jgi:hypothetical protein
LLSADILALLLQTAFADPMLWNIERTRVCFAPGSGSRILDRHRGTSVIPVATAGFFSGSKMIVFTIHASNNVPDRSSSLSPPHVPEVD